MRIRPWRERTAAEARLTHSKDAEIITGQAGSESAIKELIITARDALTSHLRCQFPMDLALLPPKGGKGETVLKPV